MNTVYNAKCEMLEGLKAVCWYSKVFFPLVFTLDIPGINLALKSYSRAAIS